MSNGKITMIPQFLKMWFEIYLVKSFFYNGLQKALMHSIPALSGIGIAMDNFLDKYQRLT